MHEVVNSVIECCIGAMFLAIAMLIVGFIVSVLFSWVCCIRQAWKDWRAEHER